MARESARVSLKSLLQLRPRRHPAASELTLELEDAAVVSEQSVALVRGEGSSCVSHLAFRATAAVGLSSGSLRSRTWMKLVHWLLTSLK